MAYTRKTKKDVLADIDILIASCREGLTGEWDCSTEEGREGFEPMIDQLEKIRAFISNPQLVIDSRLR